VITDVNITILIDDRLPHREGYSHEHGLALWIEVDDHRILFDTGQSDALLHNAQIADIDLSTAQAIVLSHGHYDHTGGLMAAMKLSRQSPVYCHQQVLVQRYSLRADNVTHEIGMPRECVSGLALSGRMCRVDRELEIAPGIVLTGPVPRVTSFEDVGGRFFLDREALHPDPLDDDLSLWIETASGIILVCGCCHSGIVNTLRHVESLRPETSVHTIIGGLHLLNAPRQRLYATIRALSARPLKTVIPCHCSGDDAVNLFSLNLGTAVVDSAAERLVWQAAGW
jgi:7,8-dihydropterin-6-yl-methyl-4-(beta-D-ribofuranosyl)aminobenzene 5'-phosphate synthase